MFSTSPRNIVPMARVIVISSWVFIGLCLYHYLSQRPLWLDENFVYDNIMRMTLGEVFGPLEHAQAFPRLYLWFIKLFSQPFDYNVLALRFWPLAAMISAMFVWKKIFTRIYPDLGQRGLLFLFFVGSYYLSYYAAEFKPYSLDVLVAGIFVHYGLWRDWDKETPRRRDYLYAVCLPLTILVSYAALFVVWIIPWNWMLSIRRNRSWVPILLQYTVIALVAAFLSYQYDLRFGIKHDALLSYWNSYFLCSESLGCFFESLWEGIRRLSTWWYGEGKFFMKWATFLIPFVLYGIGRYGFRTWFKDGWLVRRPEVYLAVFWLQLAVLGLLHKYPFTGTRVTLFMAPLTFVVIIRSLQDLGRWPKIQLFFSVNMILYFLASLMHSLVVFKNYYPQFG